jgi:hypothetical protein
MAENVDALPENVQIMDGAGSRESVRKWLVESGPEEFDDVMASLPRGRKKSSILETVKQLPAEEKKAAVKEAVAQLPEQEQQELGQELTSPVPPPDQRTSRVLWIIAVVGLSVVLVGTFVTIALGMFLAPVQGAVTRPELVLTMFTSVIGFLAGLFVGNRQG